MSVPVFPPEAGKGRVTGQWWNSDTTPAWGVWTLLMGPAYILLPGVALPSTVGKTLVKAKLDAGKLDTDLLATTDLDMVPTGWTWFASFEGSIELPTFSFTLDAGETVDFTTVIPVASSDGVPTAIGPPGPPGTANVLVVASLDDVPDPYLGPLPVLIAVTAPPP